MDIWRQILNERNMLIQKQKKISKIRFVLYWFSNKIWILAFDHTIIVYTVSTRFKTFDIKQFQLKRDKSTLNMLIWLTKISSFIQVFIYIIVL